MPCGGTVDVGARHRANAVIARRVDTERRHGGRDRPAGRLDIVRLTLSAEQHATGAGF